jgi:hydroxymethylpyrimidine/phosphomethylpyrimidine kinase
MSSPKKGRGPSHRMRRPDVERTGEISTLPIAAARPTYAPQMTRTILAIAGLDPSGGAYRHNGAAVVTSVTAQNTTGVQAIYDLPMEFIAQEIESVISDIEVHAVKVGMLGTARTTELVASLIDSLKLTCVVLDPVLKSSSGTALLEKKAVKTMCEKLIPQVDVMTPNMDEAETLTGIKVIDLEGMKSAAQKLHSMGARQVVVTGGHLGNRAIDVLYDGDRMAIFDSTKVNSTSTHGIGCTFSTAIACQLARGLPLVDAVDDAKRFVSRAVTSATKIGKGSGPLNHLATPF